MHHGYHHGMRHGKGAHHGRHMFRMLDAYDTNQDGKLSQEEIDQARGERLGKFDADGDQSLTLGEYEQLWRSEEHTSELQSLMRISYAVFCLKKKIRQKYANSEHCTHISKYNK